MRLTLVHIGARPGAKDPMEALCQEYLRRTSAYCPCAAESFRSEADFFAWLDKQQGRTSAVTVLLDSRGKQMSSEKFAEWIGQERDRGAQQMVVAIGPADGWTDDSRRRAQLLLSFGPMTLAHALARVVAAEQVYRGFTILAGHPYHGGH